MAVIAKQDDPMIERWRWRAMHAEVRAALAEGGAQAPMLAACALAIAQGLDVEVVSIWRHDPLARRAAVAGAPEGDPGEGLLALLGALEAPSSPIPFEPGDARLSDGLRHWMNARGLAAGVALPLWVAGRAWGSLCLFGQGTLSMLALEALETVGQATARGIERQLEPDTSGGDFLQATIDAIAANIGVLDASGQVIVNNQAWRQSIEAGLGRAFLCGVGANAFASCQEAGERGDAFVRVACEGFRAVALGAAPEFHGEWYESKTGRWFLVRARRPIEATPSGRVVVSLLDVTARKGAEHEAANLASIVRSSSDAIMSMTLDGTITSWNRGAEAVFGYVAGEAVGQHISMLRSQSLKNWVPQFLPRVRRGETVNNIETMRLKKDGTEVCLSISVFPVYDDHRAIVGASAIARDITEKRWAEDELARRSLALEALNQQLLDANQRVEADITARTHEVQQAHARLLEQALEIDRQKSFLEALLANMPAGVIFIDDQLTYRLANPAVEQLMMGYAKSYVGQRVGDLLPEYADRLIPMLNGVLASGVPARASGVSFPRIVEGTWSESFWDYSVHRITTPEGTGLLILALDVTEKQRAMLAQRESEERFRALAEAGFEGMVFHDGTLQLVNQAFVRMLGYQSADEVLGRSVFDFFAPESMAQAQESFRTGLDTPHDAIALRADGTRLDVELHPRNWLYQGKRTRVAAVRDITQRKRDEAALREANAELQQLALIKDHFLSTVSHELRTPLVSIRNATSILLKERAGPLAAAQRRFATIIDEQSRRLGQLVDDLLDLQQLESGNPTFQMAIADAGALVERVTNDFIHVFESRGIHCDLAPVSGDCRARFDAQRLGQVLLNLLSNAAKFTPEGGHVSVRVSRVQADVQVAIANSGVGLKADDIGKLFQKFVRLERDGTLQPGGTGLGLAICKRLIEDGHQGRIWAEPGEGGGSVFLFTLPAAHEG